MKRVLFAILFFQFWGMSAQTLDSTNSTQTTNSAQKVKTANSANPSQRAKLIKSATPVDLDSTGVIDPQTSDTHDTSKMIFAEPSVEVKPSYPGGESAFYQYIARTIKYPTRCMENEIRGQVIVRFMVDKTGSVSRLSVLKEVNACPEFSNEAIRVISTSKRWIPAQSNGRFVNCWMQIPIRFQM